MKLIQVKNEQELSHRAASLIIQKVKTQPTAVLGLATGSTPKGTYQALIEDHLTNGTSYKHLTTINLDEYVGLTPDDRNSYRFFMQTNLFDQLDIQQANTYLPDGRATELEAECQAYDHLIKSHPIDLQLLGIGQNGHIGFNEPGTSFKSGTHVVTLTHSTRKANARFFNSIREVPTQAITMGITSILKSKEILLLASGLRKAETIKRLLSERVSEVFPASALKEHPNVTLIVDEDAFSLSPDLRRSM